MQLIEYRLKCEEEARLKELQKEGQQPAEEEEEDDEEEEQE